MTSMPTGQSLSTPLRKSVPDVQLEVEAVEDNLVEEVIVGGRDAHECIAEVTTQLGTTFAIYILCLVCI